MNMGFNTFNFSEENIENDYEDVQIDENNVKEIKTDENSDAIPQWKLSIIF